MSNEKPETAAFAVLQAQIDAGRNLRRYVDGIRMSLEGLTPKQFLAKQQTLKEDLEREIYGYDWLTREGTRDANR